MHSMFQNMCEDLLTQFRYQDIEILVQYQFDRYLNSIKAFMTKICGI